jgi:hypothetical protein
MNGTMQKWTPIGIIKSRQTGDSKIIDKNMKIMLKF